MEKKKNEIDALPLICHGVGPERATSRCTLNTPTPNTLTDTPAEICTTNLKGENWNSASKPMCPSTLIALNPKNSSAFAPNCAVLLVTAK